MTVININLKDPKHYRKLRHEIGQLLFMKRQENGYSLQKAAKLVRIKPEILDEIELGKRNLRVAVVINLLCLYHSVLKLRFAQNEPSIPELEVK